MTQSRTLATLKFNFFFATAILQSVSAIYLIRESTIQKNRFLSLPAYVLLFQSGKNILKLIQESSELRHLEKEQKPAKISVLKEISQF